MKAILKALSAINNAWEWVITKLLVLFSAVMVISVFIQIVTRVIGITVIWTSDVATFLFVWLAFLGAAIAVRDNEHFVVDVFPARAKTFSFNLVLNILAIAAELVIGYIMLRYGANFVRSMALRMSYSIGVKMSYIVIVVPISGLLIILATLERLLRIKEISRPQEVQNV